MKVGLVFAKIDFLRKMENIGNEHIGLGYIANNLKKNGIDYKIIDEHLFDLNIQDVIKAICKENFDVLGFSILYSNFEESITIINAIKKYNNNIFIYVGGQHVSFCAEDILAENENIDAVLLGEGEFSTVEMVQALEKNIGFDNIAGIVYRKDGKIVNNGWRKPSSRIEDYGEINREILEKGLKSGILCSINVMAGRGCIFNCSFCTGNKIFNPYKNCSWRVRKVENVVSEIKELITKYGDYENLYEILNFCDLNFVNETPKGLIWIDEFVEKMLSSNLDIFFYIMTRVDSIVHQKERILKLKSCGLVRIEMGLEAGNEKGLSVYNKHITINQSCDAVDFLRKNRIDFGMSGFIMYHPFISIEELRENALFLKKINYWKVMFLLTKMALYPGSDITERVKKSNLLYDNYCHYEVYNYRFYDNRVEILYNAMSERLPFELLNKISESIVYLEFQLTLNYRKIENLCGHNNKLLKSVEKCEKSLLDKINDSKNIVYNFFINSLDLIEEGWDTKKFDMLVSIFSIKYTKINKDIVEEYEKYSINIEKIIEEI